MRAKLTTAKGPPWHEWIIVSRWGTAGEHLSIGRTRVPALPGGTAPIQLMPHQTAMAALLRLPPASEPPIFLLAQSLPARIGVAGDFAPAEGYVRLQGRGATLRLRAEGRCVGRAIRAAWRVEAMRVAWVGEFVEGAATPDT